MSENAIATTVEAIDRTLHVRLSKTNKYDLLPISQALDSSVQHEPNRWVDAQYCSVKAICKPRNPVTSPKPGFFSELIRTVLG